MPKPFFKKNIMKDLSKNIATILGLMLLLAVLPLSYGYYTFLRLVVFVGSLFLAYRLHERKHSDWAIGLIFIGILFNPIFPVYLAREVWFFIDLICAGIFFYITNLVKGQK